MTIYEAENAAGLANGQPFPSLGLSDPVQNSDSSIDPYLRPKAREQQADWLATVPGKRYVAILRLYGPTAAINKTWKPGEI